MNWDDNMPRLLGYYLSVLNIKSLEITRPFFDNYNNSVFEPLFEAISGAKLKILKISLLMKRSASSPFRLTEISNFPLRGISRLSESCLNVFELHYWGSTFESPLQPILQSLPVTLRKLKVTMHLTI